MLHIKASMPNKFLLTFKCMKKRLSLLCLLLCGVVLIGFVACDGTPETLEGASFKTPGDMQIAYGKVFPVKINIPDGLTKVELFYDDSLMTTYDGKKGVMTFNLKADCFGVGARNLVLRSYFADGTQQEEAIIVRVTSDIAPKEFSAVIVSTYPHNVESYTQGLEFSEGQLFEGTGDPGQQGKSILAQVDLNSGAFGLKNGLDATHFGEGITIMNGKIYQLTWKSGQCFIYDKKTLKMDKHSFTYSGDGWGLCNDGKEFIMSDGSERIYFRDPKTFQITRTIEVYDNVGPRPQLNELEYVNGKIYANIYMTNTVIAIDPFSGKVLEEINCGELEVMGKPANGDVLNGIAFNPANGKMYMTGKYWNKLFEVKFKPY